MTLTTHALVGAAAASIFPQAPALAFVAGFASHFAIDALPHWDYGRFLHSVREDKSHPLETDMVLGKEFTHDLVLIGGDAVLGAILSVVLIPPLLHISPFLALVGAGAGVLPDLLSFIYMKTHSAILLPLQRFHILMQWWEFNDAPAWFGLSLQVGMVVLIIAVLKFFL